MNIGLIGIVGAICSYVDDERTSCELGINCRQAQSEAASRPENMDFVTRKIYELQAAKEAIQAISLCLRFAHHTTTVGVHISGWVSHVA